jgi:hypothetical protein
MKRGYEKRRDEKRVSQRKCTTGEDKPNSLIPFLSKSFRNTRKGKSMQRKLKAGKHAH